MAPGEVLSVMYGVPIETSGAAVLAEVGGERLHVVTRGGHGDIPGLEAGLQGQPLARSADPDPPGRAGGPLTRGDQVPAGLDEHVVEATVAQDLESDRYIVRVQSAGGPIDAAFDLRLQTSGP